MHKTLATDCMADICSKYFVSIFHRHLDVVGPMQLPTQPCHNPAL